MSFLSTRRRTGTLLFAALVNPVNGQMWRVTGGAGNWATYNPATSLPAEFTFAFTESPAGSGRLVIASPPTGFTNTVNVPLGMSVAVWLITVASGVPTNAQIVAGGPTHLRRWDGTVSRLVDPAEYVAEQARLQALTATSTAARPYLAKLGLEPGVSPLASVTEVSEGAITFATGNDSVGMILTSTDTDLSYRITAYNDDAGTLAAEPIGHSVSLFTAVADAYTWFVSRPAALPPAYPATWPRPATSATYELHLAGATSTGSCGCKSRGCGCSSGAEATLYEGDTRERVFFLLDPGKSVVALPVGVSVEIWDEDAKRGDATVTVTDPSRWVGTLVIPTSVWNDAETPLQPGGYWLRVLDGDDQIVTVQPLTVLDPGQAR